MNFLKEEVLERNNIYLTNKYSYVRILKCIII